jgi:predicted AlkP superfamily phosphohydrolase/phosphomutase
LPGLDGFAALRVNLQGREPEGIIRPGPDYDDYLDALQTEIGSWTVGDSDRKAVTRMHRSARGAEAQRLGAAPDLMLWWDKSGPIEEIRSPVLGSVSGISTDERTGEHAMHSLVLLRSRYSVPGAVGLGGIGLGDISTILLDLSGAR